MKDASNRILLTLLLVSIFIFAFTLTAFANEEIVFDSQPQSVIGYYEYDFDTVTVNWSVNNPEGITYKLYKFNGEYEEYESDITEQKYIFEYKNGETAGKYRIEAVKNAQAVATSEEFTVEWREFQYINEIIRIDGSSFVGLKEPKSFLELYPQSDFISYNTENPKLNVWYDILADEIATKFEQGKTYQYAIQLFAKPGYRFTYLGTPGENLTIGDQIRIYGIEWEQVENHMMKNGDLYTAVFSITYDEKIGLPKQKETSFSDIVLDGSTLVGQNQPKPLPKEIFNLEMLTMCDENCTCDIPMETKLKYNKWCDDELLEVSEFVVGEEYTIMVVFHIKEGYKLFGNPSYVDFILSDVNLDIYGAIYSKEYNAIMLGYVFKCGESKSFEAGEHYCIKEKVEMAASTCTKEGNEEYYKCKCGKSYLDKYGLKPLASISEVAIPKLDHTFSEQYKSDLENHWTECECGEISEKTPHTYSNNSSTCSVCAYPKTTPQQSNKGLGIGAIIAITAISTIAVCIGVFSLILFILKKKINNIKY